MTVEEWIEHAKRLGPELQEYARRHDEDGSFVEESYQALCADGFFAALVPKELGGAGANPEEVCHFIRVLAHYCSSTALAFSMHSHLVATSVWKYQSGQAGEQLLRKVAKEDLILVSTGAGDWVESNGELQKVEGGYRFFAKKPFCSGAPMGSVLITSGRYDDPHEGPRVLHFPLPLSAQGVTLSHDWDTLGMRGTGSHTALIEGAFVPEQSIALNRPRGPWHPAFNVISTIALPILMSPYMGIAERSADLALDLAKPRADSDDTQCLSGELAILLAQARALFQAHLENAANYDFSPSEARAATSFQLKNALAQTCIACTDKAMETAGGRSFFKKHGVEQCLRDVRGAIFHPLPPLAAARFCGRHALGLSPLD